jgi:hypothetical protein
MKLSRWCLMLKRVRHPQDNGDRTQAGHEAHPFRGSEAWRVAKKPARKRVPLILSPLVDPLGTRLNNTVLMQRMGVFIAFLPDDGHDARTRCNCERT